MASATAQQILLTPKPNNFCEGVKEVAKERWKHRKVQILLGSGCVALGSAGIAVAATVASVLWPVAAAVMAIGLTVLAHEAIYRIASSKESHENPPRDIQPLAEVSSETQASAQAELQPTVRVEPPPVTESPQQGAPQQIMTQSSIPAESSDARQRALPRTPLPPANRSRSPVRVNREPIRYEGRQPVIPSGNSQRNTSPLPILRQIRLPPPLVQSAGSKTMPQRQVTLPPKPSSSAAPLSAAKSFSPSAVSSSPSKNQTSSSWKKWLGYGLVGMAGLAYLGNKAGFFNPPSLPDLPQPLPLNGDENALMELPKLGSHAGSSENMNLFAGLTNFSTDAMLFNDRGPIHQRPMTKMFSDDEIAIHFPDEQKSLARGSAALISAPAHNEMIQAAGMTTVIVSQTGEIQVQRPDGRVVSLEDANLSAENIALLEKLMREQGWNYSINPHAVSVTRKTPNMMQQFGCENGSNFSSLLHVGSAGKNQKNGLFENHFPIASNDDLSKFLSSNVFSQTAQKNYLNQQIQVRFPDGNTTLLNSADVPESSSNRTQSSVSPFEESCLSMNLNEPSSTQTSFTEKLQFLSDELRYRNTSREFQKHSLDGTCPERNNSLIETQSSKAPAQAGAEPLKLEGSCPADPVNSTSVPKYPLRSLGEEPQFLSDELRYRNTSREFQKHSLDGTCPERNNFLNGTQSSKAPAQAGAEPLKLEGFCPADPVNSTSVPKYPLRSIGDEPQILPGELRNRSEAVEETCPAFITPANDMQSGWTFLDAVDRGDLKLVKEMLSSSIAISNKIAGSALVHSAKYGHSNITEELLLRRGDISSQDAGWALWDASKAGHLDDVKIILSKRDDISSDHMNWALLDARAGGHDQVVRELEFFRDQMLGQSGHGAFGGATKDESSKKLQSKLHLDSMRADLIGMQTSLNGDASQKERIEIRFPIMDSNNALSEVSSTDLVVAATGGQRVSAQELTTVIISQTGEMVVQGPDGKVVPFKHANLSAENIALLNELIRKQKRELEVNSHRLAIASRPEPIKERQSLSLFDTHQKMGYSTEVALTGPQRGVVGAPFQRKGQFQPQKADQSISSDYLKYQNYLRAEKKPLQQKLPKTLKDPKGNTWSSTQLSSLPFSIAVPNKGVSSADKFSNQEPSLFSGMVGAECRKATFSELLRGQLVDLDKSSVQIGRNEKKAPPFKQTQKAENDLTELDKKHCKPGLLGGLWNTLSSTQQQRETAYEECLCERKTWHKKHEADYTEEVLGVINPIDCPTEKFFPGQIKNK